MNASGNPPSIRTLKKHQSGGFGLLDGLRRTFINLIRHTQSTVPSRKELLRPQDVTLPRFSQLENEFSNQILVTERLLPEENMGVLESNGARRFSAYTEIPEQMRTEFIRLHKISDGNSTELSSSVKDRTSGHAFCPIPLELDTFCDYCNQPIWGLGWGPVCQRCADCHMTCHWLCKDKVTNYCEISPPPVRTITANANTHSDDVYGGDGCVIDPNEYNAVNGGESSQHSPNCRSSSHEDQPLRQRPTVSCDDQNCVLDVAGSLSPVSRPDHHFSLFNSIDTTSQKDQKSEETGEESQTTPPPPSRGMSTRPQSMLQPCGRRRSSHAPQLPSRRHTTGIGLASSTVDAYEISSLDQRDIRERGLSVWQLSPASTAEEPLVVMSSHMQATNLAAVTGHQTGTEEITYTKVTIGPRNAALPWKPVELAKRLDIFNGNDFGLCVKMTPKLPPGDCEGQVRVHINLIRPVRMMLTSRPPSIFDIVGGGGDDDPSSGEETVTAAPSSNGDSTKLSGKTTGRVTSFRLPRGSSKLLHVHLSTTAGEVIASLLARFNISDNPQKFALYEHTIFSENEVTVRKLFDDESPLGLVLQWTLDPTVELDDESGDALHRDHFNSLLSIKRIVLQENETGDIEWSCFSEAELRTFLNILNREEADYRRRIELKYQIRKREILRLLNFRAKSRQRVKCCSPVHNHTSDDNNNGAGDADHEAEPAASSVTSSASPSFEGVGSNFDAPTSAETDSSEACRRVRAAPSPDVSHTASASSLLAMPPDDRSDPSPKRKSAPAAAERGVGKETREELKTIE